MGNGSQRRHLENVFSILRFRHRGVVSFRRFVVLGVQPGRNANAVHDELAFTQPMRVRQR